jgi:peroxin-12
LPHTPDSAPHARAAAPAQAELERLKQLRRQQQLAAAAAVRPRPAAALARAWVRCSSLLTDHLRSVLLLSVFGFKVLEWWYTSAEERLAAAAALPPPPPPPAPCPHPKGVPLPSDAHKCPLCRCKRARGLDCSCVQRHASQVVPLGWACQVHVLC